MEEKEKTTEVVEEVKEKVEKEETSVEPVIEEKKSDGKVLNIIIGVLVVVVIALGGLLGYKYLSNDKDKAETDKPEEIVKYDEEIRIDASLATQPLTDAYIKNLTEYNLVLAKGEYSNTDPAYTRLINKEADLIIVTEPSAGELERAKKAGVELEVTPVVNEGFVFFTHKDNKVSSLKLTDIQNIYSGKVNNWKALGGESTEIIAYQRPENSGSQTGMLSLVMKDIKMRAPKTTEYVETMAGIIDVVSNYENGKNAIGYSYYYYATTMYGNENMKFFAVDGVEPNYDTIQNETYPIITHYYIVTLKDNDSKAVKALKETLLGDRGQNVAKEAGYVGIKR